MNALTQPGCETDKPVLGHKKNLETIIRAAKDGSLALMECELKSTGEKLAVICTAQFDGKEYQMIPFAAMFNGNPFEMLNPPMPDGGFAKS